MGLIRSLTSTKRSSKVCFDQGFHQRINTFIYITIAFQPFEVVLEAGDVLFVPRGCPHRVDNLSASVAVSGNFVNASNAAEAVEHIKKAALMDPAARDLLPQLQALRGQNSGSF